MKFTHLHCMSAKSFSNWKEGNSKLSGPWSVSDRDGLTYLWDLSKVSQYEEDTENYLIHEALSSGITQAACDDSESIFLFFLDLTDCNNVQDDDSCPGMDECSSIPESDLSHEYITQIREYKVNKWILLFNLAGLIKRDLFNQGIDIDPMKLKAAETIGQLDYFPDEAYQTPTDYTLVYPSPSQI